MLMIPSRPHIGLGGDPGRMAKGEAAEIDNGQAVDLTDLGAFHRDQDLFLQDVLLIFSSSLFER